MHGFCRNFKYFTGLVYHLYNLLKSRIIILYTMLSKRKMEVQDIPTSKLPGQNVLHSCSDINDEGENMYTSDNICEMTEYLIDNIFLQFGGCLFRQVIGFPNGNELCSIIC